MGKKKKISAWSTGMGYHIALPWTKAYFMAKEAWH
jgi:hypothetical protein